MLFSGILETIPCSAQVPETNFKESNHRFSQLLSVIDRIGGGEIPHQIGVVPI